MAERARVRARLLLQAPSVLYEPIKRPSATHRALMCCKTEALHAITLTQSFCMAVRSRCRGKRNERPFFERDGGRMDAPWSHPAGVASPDVDHAK